MATDPTGADAPTTPAPTPAPKPPVAPPAGAAPQFSADVQGALKNLLEATRTPPVAPEPPKADPAQAKIEALEKQVGELQKRDEQAQARATWDNERARVKAQVVDTGEDYEMLRALPAGADLVLQHRVMYFQTKGEVITEEAAAQAVENQLRELAETLVPVAKARRPAPKPAPNPRRPAESADTRRTVPTEDDLDAEFRSSL